MGISGEVAHFFIKISVNALVLVALLILYVGVSITQINSVLMTSLVASIIATIVTWIVFWKLGSQGVVKGVGRWLFSIGMTGLVMWIIISRLIQLPEGQALNTLLSTFVSSGVSFFVASGLLAGTRGY